MSSISGVGRKEGAEFLRRLADSLESNETIHVNAMTVVHGLKVPSATHYPVDDYSVTGQTIVITTRSLPGGSHQAAVERFFMTEFTYPPVEFLPMQKTADEIRDNALRIPREAILGEYNPNGDEASRQADFFKRSILRE